jgi:hypothetical protein
LRRSRSVCSLPPLTTPDRLALEAGQSIRIIRKRFGQYLQRDVALQLRIVRAIYLTHSTRAEQGNDLIHADAGARRKRHCCERVGL